MHMPTSSRSCGVWGERKARVIDKREQPDPQELPPSMGPLLDPGTHRPRFETLGTVSHLPRTELLELLVKC